MIYVCSQDLFGQGLLGVPRLQPQRLAHAVCYRWALGRGFLLRSPEIAQTMLRRQQAEAVISARKKIVQGAVSMVEMALNDLQARGVVDFDPERRAAMVSNLLVVLCGESEARPVINTGTLYH